MPEYRIRFCEIAAGRRFEQRNLAVGVLGQKLGRAALALEDVDLDQPIGHAQLGERQSHLVAVAGSLHRVERIHQLFRKGGFRLTEFRYRSSRRQCHDSCAACWTIPDYAAALLQCDNAAPSASAGKIIFFRSRDTVSIRQAMSASPRRYDGRNLPSYFSALRAESLARRRRIRGSPGRAAAR